MEDFTLDEVLFLCLLLDLEEGNMYDAGGFQWDMFENVSQKVIDLKNKLEASK